MVFGNSPSNRRGFSDLPFLFLAGVARTRNALLCHLATMRLLTFFQTFSDIGTVFTAKILGVEAFQAAELEPVRRILCGHGMVGQESF